MLVIVLFVISTISLVHCDPIITKHVMELSKETTDSVKAGFSKCGKSEENPLEVMKLIGKGWVRLDQDFKDLIHCAYTSAGLLDADGTFNTKVHEVLGKYKDAEQASKDCTIPQPTPEETNYFNVKCFLEKGYRFMYKGLE